jgi:hypothetical protein
MLREAHLCAFCDLEQGGDTQKNRATPARSRAACLRTSCLVIVAKEGMDRLRVDLAVLAVNLLGDFRAPLTDPPGDLWVEGLAVESMTQDGLAVGRLESRFPLARWRSSSRMAKEPCWPAGGIRYAPVV